MAAEARIDKMIDLLMDDFLRLLWIVLRPPSEAAAAFLSQGCAGDAAPRR
jgi:hypothetical protein